MTKQMTVNKQNVPKKTDENENGAYGNERADQSIHSFRNHWRSNKIIRRMTYDFCAPLMI